MSWKEKIIYMIISLVIAIFLFYVARSSHPYDKNDEECSKECGKADYGYLQGNYEVINGKLRCSCKTYGIP